MPDEQTFGNPSLAVEKEKDCDSPSPPQSALSIYSQA